MTEHGGGGAPGRTVWARARGAVVEHYAQVLRRHGPTARGMEWKDEASQRLRFSVLTEVSDLADKRVHEIGAGAGHLHDFLAAEGIPARYSGSDVSPAMVAAARRLHPGIDFELFDILLEDRAETWDVMLASGVFNVRMSDSDGEWWAYVREVLRRMYAKCRESIAFNLMTDQVDFRNDVLFYSDPRETLEFCRRELSRRVTLRHDYPLYEYTVYVYRERERSDDSAVT